MLERLKTYFTKGTSFYGLEVYQNSGATTYRLLEVSQKKGELVIDHSALFEDWATLSKNIKGALPLYVTYNTDNVITKQMTTGATLKDRGAVETLFPGLNFDNFYYQIVQLKNTSLISVCKKQELDVLIDKLIKLKLSLVGVSLGPSSLASLIDFIKKEVIHTNREKVVMENIQDRGISISKTNDVIQESYDVHGLQVNSSDLLSFGGVVGFLMDNQSTDSNIKDINTTLKDTFGSNRTFT
ncbi:MAG: hypothetical protein VXW38_11460, partial [Bacteroidota bacterium]|nr:hypothetical protein [Bacteroidota bacterium]